MKHTPFAGFDCVDVRVQAAIDTGHVEWAWLPATRAAAKAAGVTRYFMGKPCKRGHVGLRFASGGCFTCRAEYLRERYKDPEFKKSRAEYYREYIKNPAIKARYSEYYREYRSDPAVKARRIEYFSNPEFRERMREYLVDYHRKRRNDPTVQAALLEYCSTRRAKKRQATPPWLTSERRKEIRSIYAKAARLTKKTGVAHHVDHIIPLVHGDVQGLQVPWNLQILTALENGSKNNKFDGTNENESWRDDLLIQ